MSLVLDRYKLRVASVPALAGFCNKADQSIRAGDPETIWIAEPLFKDLLSSGFLEDFLYHELSIVAEEPSYFLFGASEFGAPMVESPAYSVAIKYLEPTTLVPNPAIYVTEHMLMSAWGCNSAAVELFELQEPSQNEVFDRSNHLVLKDTIKLERGVVSRSRAGSAFRLQLREPTILIQLLSKTLVSLRWIFDAQTLEPIRAAAANLNASRLQFTCHTLGALGSRSSLPVLKRLAEHPEHYVRWAAIQSICSISRKDGVESLQRALNDTHPHIRNAAQQTLARC